MQLPFKIGDRVVLTENAMSRWSEAEYKLYAGKVLEVIATGNRMLRARLDDNHFVTLPNSGKFFRMA